MNCLQCKALLTDDEKTFYQYRCKACEIRWWQRIKDWRDGKTKDTELEELFGRKEKVTYH